MSLASYQAALPRAEEKNWERIDEQLLFVPPYHIYTNRITHLYRMVKGGFSMIDDEHRNENLFFLSLPT